MTAQFKFKNTEPKDLDIAVKCVMAFVNDFPDRMGIYHGVGYSVEDIKFYVYRTKTQVVCVGQKEGVD